MTPTPTHTAPERIVVDHKSGKTLFTAMGAHDMGKPFRQAYVRADIADRSTQTHNHEFAEIKNLWDTLPERFTGEAWATSPDTMRKHALIMTGWCDVLQFYYPTEQNAKEMHPAQSKILKKHHGYGLVTGTPVGGGGWLMVAKVPHSQSKASMGAKAFQQSKSDVLDWCKDLLQIDDELNVAGTG